MNRRNFLQTTAGSVALATAPDFYAAEQAKLRLGLVSYNWGKNWDLPELLKQCGKANFSGIELRSTHAHKVEPALSETERKEVAKRFADSSVECVGPGTACEYHSPDPAVLKKNIEESKAFILLCKDIGGTGIKVRPNGLPKDVPVEKTLEQIGKSLDEVAAFGSDHGVEIRTEIHGKNTCEIPNIVTIMGHSTHPNSKLCWNCNPQDLKGDGLRKNFLALKDRVSTIHIHDLRHEDVYPWAEFFGILRETKFQGWTLLEDGKVPEDIPTAMAEVRAAWEKLTA